MTTKIDTVKARASLKPNREPYGHRLSQGHYVGFRKMSGKSPGRWSARYPKDEGKYEYEKFGTLEDTPAHARFDEAVQLAMKWFEHI